MIMMHIIKSTENMENQVGVLRHVTLVREGLDMKDTRKYDGR